MSFKFIPKKVGSINDGGRRLKVGTHTYAITSAAMEPVKSDPRGLEKQVVAGLTEVGSDYSCKIYFSVMSPNDVRREIACKELGTLWTAAGLSEDKEVSPTTLKNLIDNAVTITAVERPDKKDPSKKHVNISTIEPADDADGDDDDGEEEDDDDGSEEEEVEEEEEEEAEEEDTPPPAPAKPAGKKPWGKK
jgi:hypothetical protein